MTRLLIAANPVTRLGIRMALGDEAEICAEVHSSEDAIRAAYQHQPDVCLIESLLPGDARAAVQGIGRAARSCAVVVLAAECDTDDMLDFVRAGAIGYLPSAIQAEPLRAAVRGAAANEAAVPRPLVRELLLELRAAAPADGLTARENQVLGMLRRGHKTSEIASRLMIAPVTVRRHISELCIKLGVENRDALLEST